jgi:hypothetical protein
MPSTSDRPASGVAGPGSGGGATFRGGDGHRVRMDEATLVEDVRSVLHHQAQGPRHWAWPPWFGIVRANHGAHRGARDRLPDRGTPRYAVPFPRFRSAPRPRRSPPPAPRRPPGPRAWNGRAAVVLVVGRRRRSFAFRCRRCGNAGQSSGSRWFIRGATRRSAAPARTRHAGRASRRPYCSMHDHAGEWAAEEGFSHSRASSPRSAHPMMTGRPKNEGPS